MAASNLPWDAMPRTVTIPESSQSTQSEMLSKLAYLSCARAHHAASYSCPNFKTAVYSHPPFIQTAFAPQAASLVVTGELSSFTAHRAVVRNIGLVPASSTVQPNQSLPTA